MADANLGPDDLVTTLLGVVEDWITSSVPDFAREMVRMFVPYHWIQLLVSVDSFALFLWSLRHLGTFALFYAFANPIYASINDSEAIYSVGSLGVSFLMFCMTLYHFSDPAGVAMHTRDAVQYTFPALFFSIPTLLVVDVAMRITVGRTLIGSTRAVLNNFMLVVCCVCTQYSYCVSTNPGHKQGLSAFVGNGSRYCSALDEPWQLPVAILGTFAVLAVWSAIFNRVFRHGILLISPVRRVERKQKADDPPSAGLGLVDPAGTAKEEAMKRLVEEPEKMSAWYSTNLVHTMGFMFVQFKIFLGRFDVRTMRAALAGVHKVEQAEPTRPFEGRSELWFDFVADTGDGFNSTYSIARSLAQPQLNVKVPSQVLGPLQQKVSSLSSKASGRSEGPRRSQSLSCFAQVAEDESNSSPAFKRQSSGSCSPAFSDCMGVAAEQNFGLPRGDLLLHGGDLAYPHPSLDVYESRLIRPYEAALAAPMGADSVEVASKSDAASSKLAAKSSAPLCWMIPGNHDWFDGLETFLHTICGRHWFGGWHLPQTNLYWALELPHRWFVLGFDLGLNDDLDDVQYSYFNHVIANLPSDANVISITHGPHWYVDSYYKKESGRMHKHLLTQLGPKLRLLLAGDIHHYSRYSAKIAQEGPELIISGGGGAFLHPTHLNVDVAGYTRAATFPSPTISRALAIRNPFQFRRRNWAFEILLGTCMVLMVLPALPLCGDAEAAFEAWSTASLLPTWAGLVWKCYVRILEQTTVALAAQVGMVLVMASFPEAQWGQDRRLLWGIPLGISMSLCTVGVACGLELALMALGADGHQGKRAAQAELPAILRNLPAPWTDVGVWALRSLLSFSDLPMHIYNSRAAVCAAGAEASRSLVVMYEVLMLPYFWVLATPIATFILGTYLAVSSLCGRHVDEAFSSLRIENFKNFLRLHIDSVGNLHIYAIGIGHVGRQWKEDPMWRREEDSGRAPAQRSAPSRWMPVDAVEPMLVDYIHLPVHRTEKKTPA